MTTYEQGLANINETLLRACKFQPSMSEESLQQEASKLWTGLCAPCVLDLADPARTEQSAQRAFDRMLFGTGGHEPWKGRTAPFAGTHDLTDRWLVFVKDRFDLMERYFVEQRSVVEKARAVQCLASMARGRSTREKVEAYTHMKFLLGALPLDLQESKAPAEGVLVFPRAIEMFPVGSPEALSDVLDEVEYRASNEAARAWMWSSGIVRRSDGVAFVICFVEHRGGPTIVVSAQISKPADTSMPRQLGPWELSEFTNSKQGPLTRTYAVLETLPAINVIAPASSMLH